MMVRERDRKRKSNWSSLISGAGIMVQLIWHSLSVMATGEWRMDVSLVMAPIFRELYNAGRRKHRQHLINHNLSQIRIHYHQEVGGPFPSVSGLRRRKMRLEASCDSRQFWERKSECLMYDCHGNVCPRCQGGCSGRGWNLAKPWS